MPQRRSNPHTQLARWTVAMLIIALVLPMMAPPTRTAQALGSITVNSLSGVDANDNDNSTCTIFEAVQAANSDAAYGGCPAGSSTIPDLITFSVTGVIKVANDLNINSQIAMLGPIALSGDKQTRIFSVNSSGTLSLSTMVLQDGKDGGGGAIKLDRGTLNIAGVSFQGNEASTGNGGAIDNSSGTLRIAAGNFIGNKATMGDGGAISNSGSGSFVIEAANFNGNTAKNTGGAISNSGADVSVADVIFAGNIANIDDPAKGGGAIANQQNGSMTINRSTFGGNLSPNGSGGAIFNNIQTTMVISNTSFNGNLAGNPTADERFGGALFNMANLSLNHSTLLNNGVAGSGGGIANDRSGILKLYNTSFTANLASEDGGGLFNSHTGAGSGNPTVTGVNLTFSANAAGTGSGGGIFNSHAAANVKLSNTIIDSSANGSCNAAIQSLGHNLDSEAANTCGLSAALGDKINADPKLDIPFFNGGPIASLLTQKLKPGSAAIDAGDPAICAAAPINNEDQRGEPRPLDGDGDGTAVCDIGAFEAEELKAGFGSTPIKPGPLDFGNVKVGTVGNASLTIFETGNKTLTISSASFGGANAGEFALDPGTSLPINIADEGAAQQLKLTCAPTAVGTRTATLTLATNDPDNASVTYNLICTATEDPIPGFGSTPIAPGPLDFGETNPGVPVVKTISVFETGNGQLKVDQPVLGGSNPGDFSVNPALVLTIDDGAPAQPLPVTCNPTGLGLRTASLTLRTTDPTQTSVSFTLTCKGVPVPPPVLVPGGSSGGGIPALNGPYGVAVSPDGKFVYVTGNASDSVNVYERNLTTGALTHRQSFIDPDGALDGPLLLTISPDGKNVYIAANRGMGTGAVIAYSRNQTIGTLSKIDVVSDGDIYYCSGSGCPATCNIDTCPVDGLDGAYSVRVSPDGRYVYVAGYDDDAIVVLWRDTDTGRLKSPFGSVSLVHYVETIKSPADIDGPRSVEISPDGSRVYVTGYNSDTLATYNRHPSTGKLTFVEKKTQGQMIGILPLDGLDGAFNVTTSADGAYVYVAGAINAAVAAFRSNPTDGTLTWVGTWRDGVNGIDGLANASAVKISPDGTYLYASGFGDKAVAVFKRNLENGGLQFVQAIKRNPFTGTPATPPLDGARDIAISPNGANVYVAAYVDDVVARLDISNPLPVVESVNPGSVTAGAEAFTLDVYGTGFMPTSQVRLNGSNRPTTFINGTHLQASISASDVATAGPRGILVANPSPGGGLSNIVILTVSEPNTNPVPSIVRYSPHATAAGGPAFTINIYGSGFINTSKVRWNGADRPTTFVNAGELTVSIPASDITAPGVAAITVFNGSPGGGSSNAVEFTITGLGENPVPTISTIAPGFAAAPIGSIAPGFTMELVGTNFVEGATVQWNGSDRFTTFVDATHLEAVIPASDLAAPGIYDITVVNPGPGGGASNTIGFTVRVIQVAANTYMSFVIRR